MSNLSKSSSVVSTRWDMMPNVAGVRRLFLDYLTSLKNMDTDFESLATIEILGLSFIADDDHIFGKVNHPYVAHEMAWFKSKSKNINTIGGGVIPKAWQGVANEKGEINSNYGWCVFSYENGTTFDYPPYARSQFEACLSWLLEDRDTRRAMMVYTNPNIHHITREDGKNDMYCTTSCQALIRNDIMDYVVVMRSNDAVFGYKADYPWHVYVHDELVEKYNRYKHKDMPEVRKGKIIWQVSSLHVYQRHFHLIKLDEGDSNA